MSYLSVSKLTFTPAFANLSEEQRQTEQMAAYELVAKHGGDIVGLYVVPGEGHLLTLVRYPDERAAAKTLVAINNRGAYEVQGQRAWPLDEWMELASEATAVS